MKCLFEALLSGDEIPVENRAFFPSLSGEAAALACPRLFAGLDGASRRALAATSRAAAAACFARGTRWWRRRRGS